MKTAFWAIGIGAVALAIISSFLTHPSATSSHAAEPTPVIVELFTSEGCSSCPPADALLKQLSENSSFPGVRIIALEEHVDYWNHLGWSDPFSSSDFSQRQQAYSTSIPTDGIYTPQMVVDGRHAFVGSRSREARDTIQKAAAEPKLPLQIRRKSAGVSTSEFEIQLPDLNHAPSDLELWIAVTESSLSSNVTSGENGGTTLQHAAIVRSLQRLGAPRGNSPQSFFTEVKADHRWNQHNLAVVAFLARKHSRQILAADSTPYL